MTVPKALPLILVAVVLAVATFRPAVGPASGRGFALSLSIGTLLHLSVGVRA